MRQYSLELTDAGRQVLADAESRGSRVGRDGSNRRESKVVDNE